MKSSLHIASCSARLLASLAFGWALAACGGAGGARSYCIAVDFSLYETRQDPNAGARVDDAQIECRLNPLTGYVSAVRTFGATRGLERIPALAQVRGFDVWAGAWISGDHDGVTV